MEERTTIAATDIARLAGVGRTAVSNWRRRFDDFPVPVAGTASSPLFSLADIEEWLRRQGKLTEVPLDERVWQRLRADVEDIDLAKAVARIGTVLASGEAAIAAPEGLADLVAERGRAATFEFLHERYAEAHSRRVTIVSTEVAGLMVALAGVEGGVVLDPACGAGVLLRAAAAAGAATLLGQDGDDALVAIAQARLRLHGHDGTVSAGDALRDDRFGATLADAVVCLPPFGERNWGYDELTDDSRWTYGLPPRTEPELPWVQHSLCRVRPGGHVVVLMPAGAADRRSGRRIRAQLLRSGALRAVITLPAGAAPGALGQPHLWILRRPGSSDPLPTHVLMVDVAGIPWPQMHEEVIGRWQEFRTTADVDGAVPLIDIIDETVDLRPCCYVGKGGNTGPSFAAALEMVSALLEDLRSIVDDLRTLHVGGDTIPRIALAEYADAGALTVFNGPRAQTDSGAIPVLTLEDVIARRPPTGRAVPSAEMVNLQPGDIVVALTGRTLVAHLADRSEVVLGPGLQVLRVDPDRLDPACLAGFIRIAAARQAKSRGQTGVTRLDTRRIDLPGIPLTEQRRLGAVFRRLEALEDTLGKLGDEGTSLIKLVLDGIGEGVLRA